MLIVGLGLMSAAASWFGLTLVNKLDQLSTEVSRHLSPARLALAEAKTSLTALGLATYKIVATTDSDTIKQAGEEISNSYAGVNASLGNALSDFPQRSDDFDGIRVRLDRVRAIAHDAQNATVAGDRDRARTILEFKMEPALDDTIAQLNRLINILGGDVQVAMAAAATERARTFDGMMEILIGGTALTILIAIALAHRLVALPLQRLTEHVTRIRKNHTLDIQPAPHLLVRGDEIGVLGRSFHLLIEELGGARKQLVTQYQRLDTAINNMPQGLCMFDAEQNLIVCNTRYAEFYGLPPDLVVPGTPLRKILEQRVANGTYPTQELDFIETRLRAVADATPRCFVNELADGRVIAITYQSMINGGLIALHEDITERRQKEAQIAHLAYHDMLTNLPNRVQLREKLSHALGRIEGAEKIAVLYIDLDHFKTVNDTMGHPEGDTLLQAVADRIRDLVGPGHAVARLGGDEFAVVQTATDQPNGATMLAAGLIEAISRPFDLNGHEVLIGASVGIAVAPDDGEDSDQLMKNADIALYHAKENGRGAYRFFEPEMDARVKARRALELDLRAAVARGEFELFYQPIVNLGSDEVTGFEALLRWHSPTRGMVPPNEFIPLAEEIGIITSIGAWVLIDACREAAGWPGQIKVAVNVSAVQFKTGTIVLDVISALAKSGLDAPRLELEITETALLHNTEATVSTLNQLRDLGVRISMDDFGTGYSSLSYLRKFPFDKIKIDQSFIRDINDSPDSIAIVRAVVGLGNTLGIVTTAEGVETREQLQQLQLEGCTEVQGYLYSRPKPARELGPILRNGKTGVPAAANF